MRSPQASRPRTSARLVCAAARISASGSAQLPSGFFATSGRSRVSVFELPELASVRIAARRSALLPAYRCTDAATISSRPLISESVSRASALSTTGSAAARGSSASSRAAFRRVLRSCDTRRSAETAESSTPRMRLLSTTSLASAGTVAIFSPVTASVAASPWMISTRSPEVCTEPASSAFSSGSACSSPDSSSALMAAILSSLASPKASLCTTAASSASAGRASPSAASASRASTIRIIDTEVCSLVIATGTGGGTGAAARAAQVFLVIFTAISFLPLSSGRY